MQQKQMQQSDQVGSVLDGPCLKGDAETAQKSMSGDLGPKEAELKSAHNFPPLYRKGEHKRAFLEKSQKLVY